MRRKRAAAVGALLAGFAGWWFYTPFRAPDLTGTVTAVRLTSGGQEYLLGPPPGTDWVVVDGWIPVRRRRGGPTTVRVGDRIRVWTTGHAVFTCPGIRWAEFVVVE